MGQKSKRFFNFSQPLSYLTQFTPKHKVLQLAGITAFAAVGTALVIGTHALTPTANFEAESGTKSGSAQTVADASASGGQALQFGSASGFVTRSGTKLMLNGQDYRFTGVNIYNANSVNNYWYTLGTGNGLAQAFDDIDAGTGGNAKVMRAWFGQWQLKPSNNTVDWSVFDHTINTAKAHGYKVVVVFADQDGTWDDGIKKTLDSQWYQSGYKTVVSNVASTWNAVNQWTYKDYVGQVVNRYKNEPTVLMWQLTNEAEPKAADGSCSDATSDAGAAALHNFGDDMGGYIKGLDPNHLVSLGSIGTGQCGTSGGRFKTVHDTPNIDLCEMHDYIANQDIIGDQWNGMALRFQQCNELNKPLFVGEMGIDPNQVGGLQARADRLRSKIGAQFNAGSVGTIVWEWRNSGQNGGDTYVFGPGDPLLNSLNLSTY